LLEQADMLVSEGVSKHVRLRGGDFWSLIAWTGETGWRRYGGVERRRRIADGRGWAGDDDDGRGAGGVEPYYAQEVWVEGEFVSAVETAALLGGR
jgi:hypothetical protein